jgi:hypothetical protein
VRLLRLRDFEATSDDGGLPRFGLGLSSISFVAHLTMRFNCAISRAASDNSFSFCVLSSKQIAHRTNHCDTFVAWIMASQGPERPWMGLDCCSIARALGWLGDSVKSISSKVEHFTQACFGCIEARGETAIVRLPTSLPDAELARAMPLELYG